MKLDKNVVGVCENFQKIYLEGTMGITKKSRQLEELKQKWLKW
jgi:hypothetical protein